MKKSTPSIIVVISARGGSKGLPRKNILPLAGKPLIAWSIEAALAVNEIAHVIVSTDDDEIAQVSLDFGAEVPFMRPSELATDTASGTDVVVHALQSAQKHYETEFDWVLLLQPTSPLRTSEDIREAIKIAEEGDTDTVIGLKKVSEAPQWMKSVGNDGVLTDYLNKSNIPANRQDLDLPYIVNGAIYLMKSRMLLEKKDFYGGVTKGHIMPNDRSVDIDDEMDLQMAEFLLRKQNN